MREIKFRAWHRKEKCWIYFSLDYAVIKGEMKADWRWLEKEQQYTGLTDIAGKDIYEGDFVGNDYIYFEVKFENGSFRSGGSSNTTNSVLNQERAKRLKIIGNIYENPNLLQP